MLHYLNLLREQIQKAVDELGYIPNKAAGALASAAASNVCAAYTSPSPCRFFHTHCDGVRRGLALHWAGLRVGEYQGLIGFDIESK